jgi:LmbE family N-acetylglucosaminyl deacetylase
MLSLALGRSGGAPVRLLAIGAHPDDIEIGCCGTILKLLEEDALSAIGWVVLSGKGERADEARASAEAVLSGVEEKQLIQRDFRDGFFPYDGGEIKGFFESLKSFSFRDHLILEYEVPKYDGDTGAPNLFVPLGEDLRRRKIDHLMTHFASQRPKRWFKEDLFSGLLRLRGMECNSPTSFAEAFYCRKARLA